MTNADATSDASSSSRVVAVATTSYGGGGRRGGDDRPAAVGEDVPLGEEVPRPVRVGEDLAAGVAVALAGELPEQRVHWVLRVHGVEVVAPVRLVEVLPQAPGAVRAGPLPHRGADVGSAAQAGGERTLLEDRLVDGLDDDRSW